MIPSKEGYHLSIFKKPTLVPKAVEELRLQAVSSQDVKDLTDQSKTFKADIDTENGSIEGTRIEEQVNGPYGCRIR